MSYRRAANLDKNLIFQEYFNDEQSVRRNGGVPTDLPFDKGFANFDGVSSLLLYSGHLLHGVIERNQSFSIRLKFQNNEATSGRRFFVLNRSATDSLQIEARLGVLNVMFYDGSTYVPFEGTTTINDGSDIEAVLSYNGTAFTIYINGNEDGTVAGTNLSVGTVRGLVFGGLDSNYTNVDFELAEIYNKALTAEEVSNLYNDARYVLPNLEHAVQGDGTERNPDTNFASPSDWTLGQWSISNGVASIGSGYTETISCSTEIGILTIGDRYLIEWVINEVNGNGIRFYLDGLDGYTDYITKNGYGYQVVIATNTILNAAMRASVTTGRNAVSYYSIQKIAVEPTSKILHVTAQDGVCRNLLSEDVHGGNIALNAENWDGATGATPPTGWSNLRTAVYSVTDGVLEISKGATDHYWGIEDADLLTSGKEYDIRYKIKGTIGDGHEFDLGTTTKQIAATGDWVEDYIRLTADSTSFSVKESTGAENPFYIDYIRIKEVIPEVTNTDIEVVKDSPGYVPRFNGESSNVNCGDYNDLLGDISILTWIKLKTWGEGVAGRGKILDNRTLSFGVSGGSGVISFNRNDGSLDTTGAPIGLFEWIFVAVVSNASGISDIYINGVLEVADHDAGTPVVPTETLRIGDHGDGGGRAFEGKIPETIVLSGLLTSREISQYYTANKRLYNK